MSLSSALLWELPQLMAGLVTSLVMGVLLWVSVMIWVMTCVLLSLSAFVVFQHREHGDLSRGQDYPLSVSLWCPAIRCIMYHLHLGLRRDPDQWVQDVVPRILGSSLLSLMTGKKSNLPSKTLTSTWVRSVFISSVFLLLRTPLSCRAPAQPLDPLSSCKH